MAKVDFILQALTTANHATAIRELAQLPGTNRILASVAFMREGGLAAIEAAIHPHIKHIDFFIGIRNDITSIQAVKRLLAMKVNLYAVDTGSRHTLFHPKLYLALSETWGRAIIGSTNLTFSGLHNNIEASTLVDLDLANAADKKFADEIVGAFAALLENHSSHVFQIKDNNHADELFESGRLADEEVIPAPTTSSTVKKGGHDDLRPMKLNFVRQPKIKKAAASKAAFPKQLTGAAKVPALARVRLAPVTVPHLVWQSKKLVKRALNIPGSGRTNPTGLMGWKKGAFENIDQRHYFREEVFHDLKWLPDASPSKKERARAKFELIIRNVNYGVFELKLSHDTNTKSRSYIQGNIMTEVHWGEAKEYIATEDLLGRILYLYRKEANPPEFVIEID